LIQKKVSKFKTKDVSILLRNQDIIRNKSKVLSAISNASKFLEIQKEFETFDEFVWKFVDRKPITNNYKNWKQIPASTTLSTKLSKDLKNRGFSFVGPTICYAFMQAIGMVNDHTINCFRRK